MEPKIEKHKGLGGENFFISAFDIVQSVYEASAVRDLGETFISKSD